MEADKKNRLNQFIENPYISLWKLSLPMMLGMAVQAIYMLVDTALIGNIVGGSALASLGYVFPYFFIIMGISFGLGSGVTTFIAQQIGMQNKNRAELAASHTMLIAFAIYISLMILILFGGEHLINFQGADNSTKELALEYFIPMIAGSIFMIINIFLRSILSGEGDNTFPMILMGIGTVTNLILDLPFIYYLGIKGAAIATVISQCLVSFIFLYQISFKSDTRSYLKIRFSFTIDPTILKEILRIGVPASFSMVIMATGSIFFNVILDADNHVAVLSTGGRIEHLFFLPIISIATSVVTLVGMFYGAGKINLINKIVRYALKYVLTISILFGILFYFNGGFFYSLFTDDPEIIYLGSEYFKVFSFALPFISVGMVCIRVMQGIGDSLPMLILTSLRVIVISCGLASFFKYYIGYSDVVYIWYSILVSAILTSVSAFTWMTIKLKSQKETTRDIKDSTI